MAGAGDDARRAIPLQSEDALRHRARAFFAAAASLPAPAVAALGAACLALALAGFFLLDPIVGGYHGKWPGMLARIAGKSTKLGVGTWYLVPPALVLLFANLVDWRALSRRRLMLLYNWTSLGFFVLGGAGISGGTVLLLKNIIGRARPPIS